LLEYTTTTVQERERYKSWIIKENKNNRTAIELSVQKQNKTIVKRLFQEYKKESIKFTINEGKNNVFHLISMTENLFLLVKNK
jgi:hypothetical protein